MPESGNSGRSLVQILGVLVVLLVLVNIPLNVYGTGLAQFLPERAPIVIQEGRLYQGSGPEIYLLQAHQLRRISSPEAQRRFFDRYRHINRVEDTLLAQFDQGPPIRVWLTCPASPLLYAEENGQKRLCANECAPKGAAAEQPRPWDRPQVISCERLDQLPAGPPLTEQ